MDASVWILPFSHCLRQTPTVNTGTFPLSLEVASDSVSRLFSRSCCEAASPALRIEALGYF